MPTPKRSPKKTARRPAENDDASEHEVLRAFILAGWIAWAGGAFWGYWHEDMDVVAGAQVTATLIVAIAFSTAFIRGLNEIAPARSATRNLGGLLIGLVALGPLLGLDPSQDAARRIVVAGAAFGGVILAISAGALASRSSDQR